MLEIYKNLSWLPETPKEITDNFIELIKGSDIESLIKLSKYRLSDLQIKKLHDRFIEIKESSNLNKKKEPTKLLILSNNTFDFIISNLSVAGLRNGLSIEITILPFGNIISQLIQGIENGHLKVKDFDYIFLALDHNGLNIVDDFDEKNKKGVFSNAIDEIESIKKIVEEKFEATLIIQSIVSNSENLFGSLEKHLTPTKNQIIKEVNQYILDLSLDSNILLFDLEEIVNKIGLVNWLDPRMYYWAKLPFSSNYCGIYSNKVINLIMSDKGLSKKALILDLDNTLWGGVIGDDGVKGIKASLGDPTGEAFLNFQDYCKRLKSRGIILAVCSKNSAENALLPFKENPEMILKEDDFAVFKANWNNKADNIREIADELNIGLDSLVFIDDNPTERNLVREFIPEVSVPEVPADISFFPEIISATGLFESIRFSKDDIKRAEDYSLNKKRKSLKKNSTDISEYLLSLDMKAEANEVTIDNITRPVQLMLKTNQFNLSTRRRAEKEVKKLINDPAYTILQFRLEDKFADNGIVSVVVLQNSKKNLFIDTWVMSCRVFGRTLEFYVFDKIIELAKELDVETIMGEYKRTEKNILVEDLLKNFNFYKISGDEDSSKWKLNISDYLQIKSFIS